MEKHWTDINYNEFINAYNKYPPNWWIRTVFKYFSKSNETKKNMKVSNIFTGILIGLFSLGVLGIILNWSDKIIGIFTVLYSIILPTLIIFIFIGVWMNNKRIKKIAKLLNITIKEYDLISRRYL